MLAVVLVPHQGALPVDGAVAIDGQVVDVLDLDPVALVRVEVAGAEQVAVEADDDGGLAGALELQPARQVVARRDDDLLHPGRVARVLPRLEDHRGAVRLAVALGAQLRDVQRARGHRRRASRHRHRRRARGGRRHRREHQQSGHGRRLHRHDVVADERHRCMYLVLGSGDRMEAACRCPCPERGGALQHIYTRRRRRGGVGDDGHACMARAGGTLVSSAFFRGGSIFVSWLPVELSPIPATHLAVRAAG